MYKIFYKLKNYITYNKSRFNQKNKILYYFDKIFNEKIILNFHYFVFIFIFFNLIINDKLLRIKNKLFYLLILMIISNPFTINIVT